jgi:hypothetical protein
MSNKKKRVSTRRKPGSDPVKRKINKPQDWGRCVEAAGFLLQGANQEEAADLVGCSARSIRLWMNSDWWPECEDAANEKWGDAVLAFSRRAILAAVKEGEIGTARWVLTNLDVRFLKKKEEIDLNITYNLEMPELDLDDEDDPDDL